jgi:hypothetical protein
MARRGARRTIGAHTRRPTMPIFPEHLHIEGEDNRFRHVERDPRYQLLLDGYVAALIASVVIFIVAITVLMMI